MKVLTTLRCRTCTGKIEAVSNGTAMPNWVKMIANRRGWIKVDIGGLERYLCPDCQSKKVPAPNMRR